MVTIKTIKKLPSVKYSCWEGWTEDNLRLTVTYRDGKLSAYLEEFHCQRKVVFMCFTGEEKKDDNFMDYEVLKEQLLKDDVILPEKEECTII